MSREQRFRAKHRSQRRSWTVSDGFPNRAVLAAYRSPTVVQVQRAAVTWRAPNLDGLRLTAREKFGWPALKTDEQLLPVLRELTGGASAGTGGAGPRQRTLESFMITYHDNERSGKIRSKRLRRAVQGLTGSEDVTAVALVDSDGEDGSELVVEGDRVPSDGSDAPAPAPIKKAKSKRRALSKKKRRRKRRTLEDSDEEEEVQRDADGGEEGEDRIAVTGEASKTGETGEAGEAGEAGKERDAGEIP